MSEVEGESEGEGEGEGEVVAAVAAVRSQRLSGTWHVTAREWGILVGQLVGHHATAGGTMLRLPLLLPLMPLMFDAIAANRCKLLLIAAAAAAAGAAVWKRFTQTVVDESPSCSPHSKHRGF